MHWEPKSLCDFYCNIHFITVGLEPNLQHLWGMPVLEVLARAIRKEKEIKDTQIDY